MDPNMQRAQAERWLGTAVKLLTARDFMGSRAFAIRAKEADPNNAVSDQILAVVDTILAGEKRLSTSTQHPDWYGVLQLPRLVHDPQRITEHYRRLALMLSPERNRLPFADYALQLATEAWAVLSDPNKKWIFDNELAMALQRSEPQSQASPIRVDPVRVDPNPPLTPGLNTFQFFQPQSQQQQQRQQTSVPMWQQQPQQGHREFMSPPPPSQPMPSVPPSQQVQQLLPQWQMRDPTPAKGGDRNKGSVNPMAVTQSTPAVQVSVSRPPAIPPPAQAFMPVVAPTPSTTRARAPAASTVCDYGNDSAVNTNNNGNVSNPNVGSAPAPAPAPAQTSAEESNNDEGVEDVESFWTACPYCFYMYEYEKMYLDCTLRCQNCGRGFHGAQVPNPPPIGGGKGEDKDEEKTSSFCCWGYFPLGFSMVAWKKHNQSRNPNGASNWVPFSPMFKRRRGRPKKAAGLGNNNGASVVYMDDEAYIDLSDPSDSDSSDRDWRNTAKSSKKVTRGKGSRKRGRRPRNLENVNVGDERLTRGGGVSVGGEDLEDDSEAQEVVVGLAAGAMADMSKDMTASISRMKTKTRRTVKDVGRLDLNVEFNNEGEEHAPAVSAVNGEEDGIETILFFEGLDEFFSNMPILNVGGDDKAKPS